MAADDEIAELDARIAQVRSELIAHMDDRLIPLLVSQQLRRLGKGASMPTPPEPPFPDPADRKHPDPEPVDPGPAGPARTPGASRRAPVLPTFAPPVARGGTEIDIGGGLATWITFETLAAGPPEGLHPRVLDKAMVEASLSVGAGKVARENLRQKGILTLSDNKRLWAMVPRFRKARPAGPRPTGTDAGYDPRLDPAGALLLRTLRDRAGEGIPGSEIFAVLGAAGHTHTATRRAMKDLGLVGAIRCGPDRLWVLEPAGLTPTKAEVVAWAGHRPVGD